LLKKHLTKQVVDQLKDKKTKLGATLMDVIQSGKLLLIINRCTFTKNDKNLIEFFAFKFFEDMNHKIFFVYFLT